MCFHSLFLNVWRNSSTFQVELLKEFGVGCKTFHFFLVVNSSYIIISSHKLSDFPPVPSPPGLHFCNFVSRLKGHDSLHWLGCGGTRSRAWGEREWVGSHVELMWHPFYIVHFAELSFFMLVSLSCVYDSTSVVCNILTRTIESLI